MTRTHIAGVISMLLLPLASAALPIFPPANPLWVLSDVGGGADAGEWMASLALSPRTGTPVVAWGGNLPSESMHPEIAIKTTLGWNLVQPAIFGFVPVVAVDSIDGVHLLMQGAGGPKYAHFVGNAWTFETIGTDVFLSGAIKIGPDGTVHLAYSQYAGNNKFALHYRARSPLTGTWIDEQVVVDTNAGAALGLRIGSNGQPRLSFMRSNGDLWFGVRNGSNTWALEQVAPLCNGPDDLGLNSNDEPSIACYNEREGMIYYYKSSGAWTKEIIHLVGFLNNRIGRLGVSIAVDSHGVPHVSYNSVQDFSNEYNPQVPAWLYYATRTPNGWQSQLVDGTAHLTGYGSSLQLDSKDSPHIAYYQLSRAQYGDDYPTPASRMIRYAELATSLPEELAQNPPTVPTQPTPPTLPPKVTLRDGPYAEAGECQSDSPYASAVCWRVGQNATVNGAPTNGVVQGRVEATKPPYYQRFYADFYINAAGQQQQVHQQGLP